MARREPEQSWAGRFEDPLRPATAAEEEARYTALVHESWTLNRRYDAAVKALDAKLDRSGRELLSELDSAVMDMLCEYDEKALDHVVFSLVPEYGSAYTPRQWVARRIEPGASALEGS